MFVLHALGQCLIRTAITTITPRADMCFALASFLTRERGNRVPRRKLERLFWPSMRAADASHSLSELIRKLRRKGIHIQRDEAACIWLPRDAVSIDIEALGTEPPTSIAVRDLSVLPGYEPRASDAFNDWVDEWRSHLRLRVLASVVTTIAATDAAGDWDLTLTLADQALRIDAQNEMALTARARAAEGVSRRQRTSRVATVAGGRSTNRPLKLAADNVIQVRETKVAVAQYHSRHGILPDGGDTILVGRDDTMERLRSEASRALDGAVRSAYISAPSGIGKSRVVRDLSGWMRTNGAVVCITACGRHDGNRPLSALIQAIPQLQTLPGAAGCSPASLSCLASITQLSNDAYPVSEHDGSRYRSEAIRESVIDLIDAISEEQPLLMIVEDVHWIDPQSWALLRTIATTAQRSVFVVCTSRVRWQHASWGEPDTFVIEDLAALPPAVARTHMQNCLARRDRITDDGFIDWCVETSTGNPYFIEELVNYWITTGEQYTAPPSLVALVEARLACLRPDALRVIQAAAILGKNSTLELLQKVLEFPTHVMFASVEELSEAGLITGVVGSNQPSGIPVLCRHDIIIHAATRGLSAPGRALLHHAAARAIESLASGSHSAALLWDCADHWQAAGQSELSVRAAISCARHLHEMGLVHDAAKTCGSALARCQDDRTRAAVLQTMARSQYSAGDWRGFSETVTQVRALGGSAIEATRIHDDLELCELSAQRKLQRDWRGGLAAAVRCVRSQSADAGHRIKAAATALKIATNLGELGVMDEVYRESEPLANDPSVNVVDSLTLTMIYHAIRGNAEISANAAREILAVARGTLPPQHRLVTLINCAGALRRSGGIDEAEAVYNELFTTAVDISCIDQAIDACQRAVEICADSGNWGRAMEWIARYYGLRRPKAELRNHRHLCVAFARVHMAQGELRAAARLIERGSKQPLWDDPVPMFRSAVLATKVRLEIARKTDPADVASWVTRLAPLNAALRGSGAQDYETFTLYLGYRYSGDQKTAHGVLTDYIEHTRRDKTAVAPEIAEELERLRARPATPDEASALPVCAEVTDAPSV